MGGSGKETGDRHPKVGQGALIGASVIVLGNIKIGEGAMIASGSLVLKDVPQHRWAEMYSSNWVICCLIRHDYYTIVM